MQNRAADTQGKTSWKGGFNRDTGSEEAYAAEWMRRTPVDGDAQFAESSETIGHEAFTARFVDGRAGTVGQSYVEPLAARCDSGSQTGRPTADYKYIGSAHEPGSVLQSFQILKALAQRL
jgi:hypothetical protein